MPVFNRVRIVNIRYDHREIKDELFDYYDGCNALMNLANGSGKTVMVETLFQPVCPNMSVGKWKIIDYLTGDQRPTFVIIEWELDNTNEPAYFMTGICLSFTLLSQDDGITGKALKYFTFTHMYNRGNEFDIEHIPILPQRGEKSRYPTYSEVQDMMKKYAASHKEFEIFRKDRQKEYQEHLRFHHIYQEEWDMLKTINQEENGGGMSKLFEACKTSDLLFDRWILKKISDTHAPLRQSLMQALTSMTLPMIESDEKLREKEQAEEIAGRLSQFEEVFGKYTDALDRKEQKERFLAGVLLHVVSRCSQEEKEKSIAQLIQENCRDEEKRIQLEELSEQFHTISREMKNSQQMAEDIEKLLPDMNAEAETAKREHRLMQAAEYMCAKKQAVQELTTARNLLATLEQGDQAQRLHDLGFTLRTGFTKAAQEAEERYCRLQGELAENERSQKENDVHKRKLEDEYNSLTAEHGRLTERLSAFEERSKEFRHIIGVLPETDMLGDIIPESAGEIHDDFVRKIGKARSDAEENSRQISLTAQAIQDNRKQQRELEEKLSAAQEMLHRERNDMADYQRQSAQITEILSRFDIDEKYLYEKEENLVRMREKLSSLQTNLDSDKRELDRTEEKLRKYRDNCLHTSPEFARLLEENGISFQTGEAYLKQQDRDFQEKLLEMNPLLPYCYLVSSSDYEKVVSIPSGTFSDKLCPVLRRSDIELAADRDTYSANIGALHIYSLYDRESMEQGGEYEQSLIRRREALNEAIHAQETAVAAVTNDIHIVENFTLTAVSVEEKKQSLAEAEKKVQSVKERKSANISESEKLAIKQDELREALRIAQDNEKVYQEKLARFQEYMGLAVQASKTRTDLADADSRQSKVRIEKRICEDADEKLRYDHQELRDQQARADSDRKKAQSKMSEYVQYTDGELLEGEPEQLEMEYKPLYSKQSQSRGKLDEQCRNAQQNISKNQNALTSRFGDLEESDIPPEYDQNKLSVLEKREKETSEKVLLCSQRVQQEREKAEQLEKEYQKICVRLREAGAGEPLAPQLIRGNYSERRAENDIKRQKAVLQEKNAREELDSLNARKNVLEKLIDIGSIDSGTVVKVTEDVDISVQQQEFRKLVSDTESKLEAMKDAYKDLCEHYRDSDSWVRETVSFIRIEDCHTYSSCYYLFDQLKEKESLLHEQIKVLQTQLSNIESSRSHMIQKIYDHADFLVKQVRDISANSFVTIKGKRRRMLEISLPDNIDSQAQQRIANLVDSITLGLRQEKVTGIQSEQKLYEDICSRYSDRVIFNAYTDQRTVRVRVLKMLQDEHNIRLENWEARYSGGERFITYFIAYSALADYARRNADQENIEQTEKIRSVFMVDNPFGEASSDHLVKTLIEITKKFDMQLICFSDLRQSSITNHFDLIYQLSMRNVLYSNRSLLHTDDVVNHADAQRDSRLDYVSLRNQISFF